MFAAIAIHHAAPNGVEGMLGHMRRVVANAEGAEGLHEFRCWREADGRRLIAFSFWDSRESFEAALPLITEFAAERDPAWTDAEDELLLFDPA